MKKYWAFCKANIQNTFAYRGPILVWLICNILSLIAIIAVWLSASTGQTIGGYTKSELITYYIAALFLDWFTNWLPFYDISSEIKEGRIITSLTKPFSYYWHKFGTETGWHLVSLFIGLTTSSFFAFLFRDYLVFNLSLIRACLLVLVIILSIFTVFSLSVCLGLLAFWFTEVFVVENLFWVARTILAGRLIPISFIPAGIYQMIARALPFRYMFSFPLEIYFDKLSGLEIVSGLGIQIFWIIVLSLVYKLMWSRGRRAYTAFGQ
jgi:ABC-2 type transport system permease protein